MKSATEGGSKGEPRPMCLFASEPWSLRKAATHFRFFFLIKKKTCERCAESLAWHRNKGLLDEKAMKDGREQKEEGRS